MIDDGPRGFALVEKALQCVREDIDWEQTVSETRIDQAPESSSAWRVSVTLDRDQFGFEIETGNKRVCEIIAEVADRFQDGYLTLRAAARPTCPLHGHLAVARCIDDEARWCCAAGAGQWSVAIGGLTK